MKPQLLHATLLFALVTSSAATAAPMAVEISLEIRGSHAVGFFSHTLPPLTVDFMNLAPDGSFQLDNFQLATPTNPYYSNVFAFDVDNTAVLISGQGSIGAFPYASFGPTGGGGFGGDAPIRTLSLPYFLIVDRVVGKGWLQELGGRAMFGRDGTFRIANQFGYDIARGPAGEWTTRTVTLSGTHDVAGVFTTRLGGADERTAGGLGQIWMVSPVMLQDLGDDFPYDDPGSQLPLFAVMHLNFVPEPAGITMVAIGLIGLGRLQRT